MPTPSKHEHHANKSESSAAPLSLEYLAWNRLSFGPSTQTRDAFLTLGKTSEQRYRAFVEQQVDPDHINDSACEVRLKKQNLTTLSKSVAQCWQDHRQKPLDLKEKLESDPNAARKEQDFKHKHEEINHMRHQPARDVEDMTWTKAVYSKRQLQEIIVGFWHDHFSVFAFDDNISPHFSCFDRDVIRKHCFGNFRQLLGAVAQSPAMIFYLDNFVNQSGNANENYARDLLDLHTLGAVNYLGTQNRVNVPGYKSGKPIGYVDGDVYETARCFTGWRVDTGKDSKETGEFLYFEPWHDRFQKIVLGRAIPEYQSPLKDGNDVLDVLSAHPGTARFIARKLCQKLCSDIPPESLVQKMAAVFHEHSNAKDQIKKTLQALLTSKEFLTSATKKFKRPFEFMVGMLRATDADFLPTESFMNAMGKTGHRLFQWRTPDGFPDASLKWNNTGSVLETWRLCHQAMLGKIDGITIKMAIPEAPDTPINFVTALANRLMPSGLPASDIKATAEFLAIGRDFHTPVPGKNLIERVPSTIALLLMTPTFRYG